MKTGMRLKVLRADRDLTQTRLAGLAGLSAARYWQIENGEGSVPSDSEKKAVASALNVPVNRIAWPEVLKARTA